MLEACKAAIGCLQQHHVWEHVAGGPIEIVETDPGGEGKICFAVSAPFFVVKFARSPIRWLSNQKFSDGAFFTLSDGGAHIHLVELKSNLTHKEWVKAKSQCEGMLLNVLAMLGAMRINCPISVTVHIAFKSENITPRASASPALMKMQVGVRATDPPPVDFVGGSTSMLGFEGIPIKHVKRGVDGNGSAAI